jgi:hypothetical protein
VKIIVKNILAFQEAHFFAPLRDKVDYARLIAYSARNLLLDYDMGTSPTGGYMKLIVDKMSRLFFYAEKDYLFSVSFPFTVRIANGKIAAVASYSGKEVDNRSISHIISVLESEKFKLNHSLLDYYIETDTLDHEPFLLLEEILQFEPTYIRYDNDPRNEDGKLHPLHHLDINYSPYGTYKLGLDNAIADGYLEDMLNIETECFYIK